MMMTSDQQTQLLGAPKEVDVVAIERELVSPWKNASEGMAEDGSSTPVMRACSLIFRDNDKVERTSPHHRRA